MRGPLLGLPLGGREARRFVLAFGVCAGVLLGAYYFPHAPDGAVAHALEAYLRGYARVTGAVLRLFEPGLTVSGQDLIGRYVLRVAKTCDAMDVSILFVCAVAAWPCPWRRRVAAAAGGLALIAAINVVRICSLYYVGIHFPSSFNSVHLEVWPLIMVALTIGAFVAFAAWDGSRRRAA